MSQIVVLYSDMVETMPLISLQLNSKFERGIATVVFIGKISAQVIVLSNL